MSLEDTSGGFFSVLTHKKKTYIEVRLIYWGDISLFYMMDVTACPTLYNLQ